MKIRLGTFNLFQFVEPPYSWYFKKDKFNKLQWQEKTQWIKNQISLMNCDVIGFQEVFSRNTLKDIVNDLGFKYFETVDVAKTSKENSTIYTSTTVAIASKFPISNIQEVKAHIPSIKKHHFEGFFKFSRIPIKATVILPNEQEVLVYVCHLKSNRLNEFEYTFKEEDLLTHKKSLIDQALKNKYSNALKQRLCEASSLFFDIKKEKNKASLLICDLNDKEFSITIDALCNNKYHDDKRKDSLILHDAYNQLEKTIYNPHPEQKEIKRTPTSFFAGKGNVLDYIFISKEFNKKNKNCIAKVSSYTIFNKHLEENPDGSLLKSDHAQVVCELTFK
jgi:endonuclease/exonuclease/phosphatase family metal-dependent hydrolase